MAGLHEQALARDSLNKSSLHDGAEQIPTSAQRSASQVAVPLVPQNFPPSPQEAAEPAAEAALAQPGSGAFRPHKLAEQGEHHVRQPAQQQNGQTLPEMASTEGEATSSTSAPFRLSSSSCLFLDVSKPSDDPLSCYAGLPEPRSRRGSAVEASKRVASFIAQQNKSFKVCNWPAYVG